MAIKSGSAPDPSKPQWWKKHRLARMFYEPLLVSNQEYYVWNATQREDFFVEDLKDSKKIVEGYRDTVSDVVIPETVLDDILGSIHYYVLKDEEFIKMNPHNPPKVFVLKGGTGTGKTSIVHSIACRAVDDAEKAHKAVWFSQISTHNILTKWLGDSEKAMARSFDVAFVRPTILFFDEAQALFTGVDGSKVDMGEDSGALAYKNVQATFLEKVNELIERKYPTILILATNEFGSLNEAVKRRGSSGTFDLDKLIDRKVLLEIVVKQSAKYKIELKSEDVLSTIEAKILALGHQVVTPADIVNVFGLVYERKMRDFKQSYLHRLESKVAPSQAKPTITLMDFRDINDLKEYAEENRSAAMKKIVQRIKPNVQMKDIGGMDEIKYNVLKDVQVALDYQRAIDAGATPVRGILLYGSAGTGKTYLGQAIANELNATLYMLHGAQIMSKWAGETEKIVSQMFDDARKTAPSIILIDEIDAMTLNREAGGHLGAVTTFLSEMGGTKPMQGVVVIGTTNKPQMIDPAFLRAGRFDRLIEIPPPRNDTERKSIIEVHLRRCRNLASNVTADSVLKLLGRRVFVPARIERLVSDAIELRVKELEAASQHSRTACNERHRPEQETRSVYADDLIRLNVI